MCCTETKKLNNCVETAVFRGLAFSMIVTRKRYVENIHKCLAQKLRSYLKNDSVHKKKLLLTQVPHRKIKYLYQHTDSIFIDHFLWIQWTFLISNNSTLLQSQAVIIFLIVIGLNYFEIYYHSKVTQSKNIGRIFWQFLGFSTIEVACRAWRVSSEVWWLDAATYSYMQHNVWIYMHSIWQILIVHLIAAKNKINIQQVMQQNRAWFWQNHWDCNLISLKRLHCKCSS